MSESLANFFIVGAAKAGTTSLHAILSQHDNVFMSDPKELNYFSHEELTSQKMYYNSFVINDGIEYGKVFENADDSHNVIGESSVSYLFYPGVSKKIKEYNPSSKILIVLRNPIERAFSHYMMDFRLGFTKKSFATLCDELKRGDQSLTLQQYFKLGLYHQQVRNYLDVFGANNVLIILYEDFKRDPDSTLSKVSSFLSLQPFNFDFVHENKSDLPKNLVILSLYRVKKIRRILKSVIPRKLEKSIKSNWFKKSQNKITADEFREFLMEYYSRDVKELEHLVNLSVREKWGFHE